MKLKSENGELNHDDSRDLAAYRLLDNETESFGKLIRSVEIWERYLEVLVCRFRWDWTGSSFCIEVWQNGGDLEL
jgi:hypothetical protein